MRFMGKVGCLDSVEDGILKGWAQDEERITPAVVDLAVNGQFLDTIACSEYRPDLVEAGRGCGDHGFTYPLPASYMQSRANVSVRFAGGGPFLHNGERVLPDFTKRFLISEALFSRALSRGLWCIDEMSLSDRAVAITGWCIPPALGRLPVALTHNGNVLEDLVRFPRNDIAIKLDLPRDEIGFGFKARGPIVSAGKTHQFAFEHALARRPFDANQTIHFVACERPLPPEDLRVRAHGSTEENSFMKEGSTVYVQIERILKTYFAKQFEDFASILDWGCGSGRSLRYFTHDALSKLTGIDIDRDAIQWCQQAFPEGRFLTVDATPPTALPPASFDLIYANSVLTHLRQMDQLLWIEELHRLARPGGVLLLTTFGEVAWWGRKFPSDRFVEWRLVRGGFYEGGRNENLAALGIGDYYRNVFVSADYILNTWSRFFEIIDFIPAGIGNLQDLTILRKQAG